MNPIVKNDFLSRIQRLLLLVLLSLSVTSAWASGDHGHGHSDEEEHEEEEAPKGPNGGRLMEDDGIQVELAIFERGVPPEYRAWVKRDGKAVKPADATLTVELERLGGRIDRFIFTPRQDYLLGNAEVEEPHSFAVNVNVRVGDQSRKWSFESYEGRLHMEEDIAEQAGVRTAIAGSGPIRQSRLLYGQIINDPRQISQIRARFPGQITRILPALGDRVKAGETVAEVEANESLRRYSLSAPISGTVVAVHANVGDFAGDQPLLTIVNQDRLWAEFKVFSQDRALVKAGMPVHVRQEGQAQESKVELLVPALGAEPYGVVRVPVDNHGGDWAPGMLVEGDVVTSAADVPLLVDNRALQGYRDWTVVFIQVGEDYEIRPLELGRSDGRVTEVLGGLNAGDRYVVENSYLLKADLEKSGASHDH